MQTSEGKLTCYDTKKGDKLWEEDLGEFNCKSSPAMVGKELFIFGEDGKCWVLAPSRAGVKRVRQANLGEGAVRAPRSRTGGCSCGGRRACSVLGRRNRRYLNGRTRLPNIAKLLYTCTYSDPAARSSPCGRI